MNNKLNVAVPKNIIVIISSGITLVVCNIDLDALKDILGNVIQWRLTIVTSNSLVYVLGFYNQNILVTMDLLRKFDTKVCQGLVGVVGVMGDGECWAWYVVGVNRLGLMISCVQWGQGVLGVRSGKAFDGGCWGNACLGICGIDQCEMF